MVLRAGIGVDAEVDALLTSYRQQQLDRIYHGLGFSVSDPDSHPLVLLGLRGWLSLLEEVCMQWVLQPDVTREQVVLLLEQSLQAILRRDRRGGGGGRRVVAANSGGWTVS